MQGLQPVDHRESVWMLLLQHAELVGKDHRVFVAVGVEEHHVAGMHIQCGAQDREHRRDPGAASKQQQITAPVTRGEDPAGWEHPDLVPNFDVVAEPVGGIATNGSLHSDLMRTVVRGAGE